MFGSPNFARLLPLVVLVAAGLGLPFVIRAEFYFLTINIILSYAVLALGLNLLVGNAGQFAFSHVAFFGIGAYATALLQLRFGIPFVISLPLAALLAGLVGVLIAIPATRMRDINLALATFAFAEGVHWLIGSWESVTGGSNGLSLPPTTVFGLTVATNVQALPWMSLITALAIAAALYLVTSKTGRSMAAIRESEAAAAVSGVNVRGTKILVFGISAVYAGVAGGMLVLHQSFLDPSRFGFTTLVLVFSMIVVGGLGSIVGTLIGVVLLALLPELMRISMRSVLVWQEFAHGLILILFMMFMPRGIWGALRALADRTGGLSRRAGRVRVETAKASER